ncbi:uncharacterized protein A4U43_C08F29000 [Asparagus officinalis]|nr:uncharacterized protein A4U43_C08F29000 [Asparagus officinalis]
MEGELKGVVIISLPPKDDPSQGKTITAFTFTDPNPSLPRAQQVQQAQIQAQAQAQAHHDLPSFLPSRRTLAAFVGFTLIVSSLFICLLSEDPLQLLQEESSSSSNERKREENSFWLPLYPKSNGKKENGTSSLMVMGDMKLVVKRSGKFASGSSSSAAVLPLRGNIFPDGQYYTSIFIGNPPRPYFLDVDTGSDLTWIQCDAPCTSCAKGPHPLYKPTKGKIVQPRDSLCQEVQRNLNSKYCDSCQQCDYEIEYADHSSSMGVLAQDDMHLVIANGDRARFNFAFGCAYDQQGQLLASPAKTDGILGLSNSKVSLPSQLANQGITNNVVGHCITSEADGGGYLFFGDDFVPRWGMTWVPTVGSLINYYQTVVLKLSYGDKQINQARKGANLASVSNNLNRDHSDETFPVCWRAGYQLRSVKDVEQFFPPLTLQFGNRWLIMSTKFTIAPEGYLIISSKGNVCLGILNGSDVHDGSAIILGDISLRGKLIVYDNMAEKIGWTSSNCVKPQRRPKDFPFFF